ncbi:MAG: hypothetical protein ACKVJG_16210, partial [Candidatus Latescibacterota bacterium]
PIHGKPHIQSDPAFGVPSEALEGLQSAKAKRRQRGLRLLAELRDPDLFEWCAMMLTDEHLDVQVIALKTMRQCEEIEFEMVEQIARSSEV